MTHLSRLDALLQRAAGNDVFLPAATEPKHTTPVPDEGPLDAKIIILGESLGHEEVLARRNFVGKSGQKLRNHMRLAGIHPEKCRILNVYPFYPEGGSIDKLDPGIIREWQAHTLDRLRACYQATVVVCIGNVALETCTGFRDITRRRGSVYEWEGLGGRRIKVVGMIHPAAILHSRGRVDGKYFEKMCRLDWERVKLMATPHEMHHRYCGCALSLPRVHITPYNTHEKTSTRLERKELCEDFQRWIQKYCSAAQRSSTVMALDVETPKVEGKRQLLCVSFSYGVTESLVLPFREYYDVIKDICESPCVKVGHNIVSFDRWWLAREGITLRGEIRDTMCIHHCLDPASPQRLEFLTSQYTWEPWYKDEGKGHDITLIEKDLEGYYRYCGLDSCVTLEVHNLLWPELERRGMFNFYKKHYEALYDPILDVMLRGVTIDHTYRQSLLEDMLHEVHTCRDRLGDLNEKPLWTLSTQRDRAIFHAVEIGDSLEKWSQDEIDLTLQRVAKKTVSNAQLMILLYDKLGLPLQVRRRKGHSVTPTADAVALRHLRLQYADRSDVVEVLDTAIKHNKVQKLATFLYPTTFDPSDGRFRFTLKLNTEAARLASAASPDGSGRNSQNTPRDDKRIRRTILSDPGHVIVEADASQIEGRIVFVRTKDPELINLGRARIGFDQHAFTASMVFKKPVEQVGKGTQERQVAKSIGHAAQRAMQGKTMADWMIKNNMTHEDLTPYSAEECCVLLESYYEAFPGIPLWQQRIRREVRATRRLINRWGRVWDVRYEELNDDLYRKAYNFLPQSECADLTNQCFADLYRWLKTEHMSSRIMMQEHDSLVISCAVDEAHDVAVFMRDHLEVELDYDGVSLSVPVEFKIGKNWGDCVELGALPNREMFKALVQRIV